MGKALKIDLFRYDNFVFGRVLYQSKKLRAKGCIITNNEYSINSESSPEMSEKTLYIKGNGRSNDNAIIYNEFETIESAKEWVDNIVPLIDEINDRYSTEGDKDE